MAFFTGMHYSANLARQVEFTAVLPIDAPPMLVQGNPHYQRKTKSIYMLHGFSDTYKAFINGANINDIAVRYNVAIFTPTADNSFYLNRPGTGHKYETYVGEEFIEFTRKLFNLSNEKEDTYILGVSMGGYGAIHLGLRYNDTFKKIAAFSPALIQREVKGMKPGHDNGMANYDYYLETFGDLEHFDKSSNNPEYQLVTMKEQGIEIPPMYRICGTEDFLYMANKNYGEFLKEQGIEETYKESTGVHDWIFWNQYMSDAVEWFLS